MAVDRSGRTQRSRSGRPAGVPGRAAEVPARILLISTLVAACNLWKLPMQQARWLPVEQYGSVIKNKVHHFLERATGIEPAHRHGLPKGRSLTSWPSWIRWVSPLTLKL